MPAPLARALVRHRLYGWYVLGVLMLVAVFNYIDRQSLAILQIPIKAELGLSDTQLGSLTGLSFALLYSAFALPIARLADRHNRIRLRSGHRHAHSDTVPDGCRPGGSRLRSGEPFSDRRLLHAPATGHCDCNLGAVLSVGHDVGFHVRRLAQ